MSRRRAALVKIQPHFMTKPKKQHFVPQCLLKHFATNERISIFDSSRNMMRNNRLVKEEFAQNYFYGKDGTLENIIDKKIENPAAPLLDKFSRAIIDSELHPHRDLLVFILAQFARTPGSISEATAAIYAYLKTITKQIGDLNGFPPEISDKIEVKLKNEKDLLPLLTSIAVNSRILIADLGQRLLINETEIPFVISDHPVSHYNWFLRSSSDPAKTSLPATGIKIFLPISPKVTLCLYDRAVYRFENRRSPITIVTRRADAHLLNSLQAMNRESSIIFSDKSQGNYVRQLCREHEPISLHTSASMTTTPEPVDATRLSTRHAVWRIQRDLPEWFSFVKIRKDAKARQGIFAYRQPGIVETHKRVMHDFYQDKFSER